MYEIDRMHPEIRMNSLINIMRRFRNGLKRPQTYYREVAFIAKHYFDFCLENEALARELGYLIPEIGKAIKEIRF